MTKWRAILLRTLLGLAAVAGLDVALSLTWLRSGRVGKRPLPPFGLELDPQQQAVLLRLENGDLGGNTVMGFDRELGWCVRPLAVHVDETTAVHVNARGMRAGREYPDAPEPGKLRVACYGDSFVFCDEVKDNFTFEAFLESRAPAVEALNFGVPAYGTDQALLRLRREGVAHARVAVLGLLLENIGRNVNRYRPLWTPRTLTPFAKPRFVFDGPALRLLPQPFATGGDLARAALSGAAVEQLAQDEYWLGRPEVWPGTWSSLARLACGYLAYRERDPRKLWLDTAGEPRRVTLQLVDEFQKQARALGAKEVLVLVFPMREELEVYERTGRAYWSAALADLAARGIECIDLAPALAEEDRRLARDPAGPTVYVAAHLSSAGNQVVAQALERWLVEHHLLLPRPDSR